MFSDFGEDTKGLCRWLGFPVIVGKFLVLLQSRNEALHRLPAEQNMKYQKRSGCGGNVGGYYQIIGVDTVYCQSQSKEVIYETYATGLAPCNTNDQRSGLFRVT